MTESTPFDGDESKHEGRGSRRLLLVGGGLAATVALALGGFLLLGGGEEELPLGVAPVLAVGAVATPTAMPTAAVLPRAFDQDLGRNPFKALYVVPVGSVQGPAVAQPAGDPTLPDAPTGATSGSTTPAAPGTNDVPAPDVDSAEPQQQPAQPAGPVGPAGPAGPTGPAGPAAPAAPTDREYALVLRSVSGQGSEQRARFTIDGMVSEAAVGDRFGPTKEIRLISLQEGPGPRQWTAVLQVGDGEPFDAVTGQAVSVR